ncbi:MAG: hypothetical protein WCI27_03745 [Candidatus Omnitrophota bacterium]
MKKFLLSTAVLLVSGSLAFAQNAAPVKTITAPVTAKSIAGKIKSVSEADAAKGTKSEIIIIGQDDISKAFLVKSGTTIYDNAGKALTLKDLKADQAVRVNYKTSAEGVLEALAVYQIK